ncbi:hypothetical protein [Loktanella sp. S4079]|uniref:hypothetical protein n=1 Tax=Loktanella sp. S4079 TaxID=579483 RepID=UPI0005FA129D|nr:hypothetical protein [Loktanella sp. S4079]KJZ18023.1 hypothetical protein TW80_16160 [Loktanella sp. S4079]
MQIIIPATDHGQIRVFATDMPLSADVTGKTETGIAALLGASVDVTYIDVVCISDLGAMTLSEYIASGYDMLPDAVDKAAVDAITGYAILLLSRATAGKEVALNLAPGLRHVTTYSPTLRMAPPADLPSDAAEGVLPPPQPAKAPKSDARISGMVATAALVVMFLIVGMMIWIAG